MPEPDYRADEDRLFDATRESLAQFAAEHADETFCYFTFDCNADYGEVLLCLDTQEQSLRAAKAMEGSAIKRRQTYGSDYNVNPSLLPMAKGTVCNNDVLPFGNGSGDFAYQGFATVMFDDWQDFVLDDKYPQLPDGDDYLACKASILFGRVIDRLVAANAFAGLKRTVPFLIGFDFHDGGQFIVRMLWE